jgi:hypothetical protein
MPLIAIVGSVHQTREQEFANRAIPLKNIPLAKSAAEHLGRAFAQRGCRILVYSSDPAFIELDLVRGYAGSKDAQPQSIDVLYPINQRPSFPEENDKGELFNFIPDANPEWEVSFYRSLRRADGVILLGGGTSTLIAGLVAMGFGKSIVAYEAFGGYASKIWGLLSVYDLLSQSEISLMAEVNWTPALAEKYVDILLAQQQRMADKIEAERAELLHTNEEQKAQRVHEQEARRAAEEAQSKNVNRHAVIASLLFLLALVPWPLAWGIPDLNYIVLLFLLLAAPLLAGISGSTILVVINAAQGNTAAGINLIRNVSLGLLAGGAAGILSVLSQFVAVGGKAPAEQLSRLVPFTMIVGFVAGLTTDTVFGKLRKQDVVQTGPLTGQAGQP